MGIGYSAFVTPVGNLAPTVDGARFSAPFGCTATFTNDSGPSCADGEYRQFVRGLFSVNGMVLAHYLCRAGGTVMSSEVFAEDGCPPPGCTSYGHRACTGSPFDAYSAPDRATGSHYASSDSPGFSNVTPGMTYTIELSFQASLIDVSSSVPLATADWTIVGQTVTSPSLSSPRTEGLQPDDRVLAVHAACNLDHGGQQIHVVIGRRPGSPPLDAGAVTLVLRDEHGEPIAFGDAVVHEVAIGARATASIVFDCPDGARAATGEVTVDAGALIFNIIHR